MSNKKIIVFGAVLVLLAVGWFLVMKSPKSANQAQKITNFEECKNAGYPIMESYPERCRDTAGTVFINNGPGKNPSTNPVPVINPPSPKTAGFNKSITMGINERITFTDGLSVLLKRIDDSRCKPNVQCIWAGELGGTFALSGGKLTAASEIRLGTVTSKSITAGGYTFSLLNATENSMTIVVK